MPASVLLCLVVAIADGDTLTARCGPPGAYHQLQVRIAAIDAPERRQAFGQRARQNLAALCFRQQARIQPLSQDAYGRAVADVQCRGQDAGQTQVRAGMAWVYTAYAQGHPQLAPPAAAGARPAPGPVVAAQAGGAVGVPAPVRHGALSATLSPVSICTKKGSDENSLVATVKAGKPPAYLI